MAAVTGGSQPAFCWPQDRLDELETLRTLLNAVGAINNGSHCLERIQLCIDLADRLSENDFLTPRKSFLSFLSDQAAGISTTGDSTPEADPFGQPA